MKTKLITVLLFSAVFLFACEEKSDKKSNTDLEENSTQIENIKENEQPDTHTSENSLDWAGTYQGVLPCADCPGIETTVILNQDLTFSLKMFYLERDTLIEEEGEFEWQEDGQRVVLETENQELSFFVGENFISQLDEDGNRVTGELAEKYILKKAIE